MLARFNHWIARNEGYIGFMENVRHKAILPAVPWVGAAIVLGQIAYDSANAPTPELRRKATLRDTLSALGAAFGVWLGVKAKTPKPPALKPGELPRPGLKGWGWSDKIVLALKKVGINLSEDHCHHSISEPFLGHARRSPLNRVKAMFQSSLHSHMGKALVDLGLLSALPIFLGGIPFGALADALNGEDVSQTLPHKFKEGIFQWVGNVMFCTLAIYGASKGAHKLTQALWKNSAALRRKMIKGSEKAFQRVAESLANSTPEAIPYSTMPSQLTGSLSYFVRQHRGQPNDLIDKKLFNYLFKDRSHTSAGTEALHTHASLYSLKDFDGIKSQWAALKIQLRQMMATNQSDRDIVRRLQQFYTRLAKQDFTREAIHRDRQAELLLDHVLPYLKQHGKSTAPLALQHVADAITAQGMDKIKPEKIINKLQTHLRLPETGTSGLQASINQWHQAAQKITPEDAYQKAMHSLAQTRLNTMGDVTGALIGVVAGIFGGAVLSNGINSGISHLFGLPQTHTAVGLMQDGHDAEGNDTSFLAGKVGERGIRVADGLMHLDDLPTVLYMAGMHVIEAFIHVLYGAGGFLAGMAGTVYNRPPTLHEITQDKPHFHVSMQSLPLAQSQHYWQTAQLPQQRRVNPANHVPVS